MWCPFKRNALSGFCINGSSGYEILDMLEIAQLDALLRLSLESGRSSGLEMVDEILKLCIVRTMKRHVLGILRLDCAQRNFKHA